MKDALRLIRLILLLPLATLLAMIPSFAWWTGIPHVPENVHPYIVGAIFYLLGEASANATR